ncbi:hypothetical protein F2Q68_00009365 [Brassica cretica]|uniref:Uncharacterized protein n=1 Tax=Brassica cretica TaxID=69181 RepID=A0A8S9KRA2_BRACR|nr:hypothetical protein F2Q68_00009365 [Brassica cretica]
MSSTLPVSILASINRDTFVASLNGISNVILLNAFLQITLSSSRLVCVLLGGKGGRVLYTLSTAGSARVRSRSTLFPECRSIFTVVSRSAFVLSCRSISVSSSISRSSSLRSMASSSVLGLSLPRVRPGRRPVSLSMAVAFSAIWLSSLLMCSLRTSNFLISSLKIMSIFPFRSVANLRFPVKAWFTLDFALPRRDPTVAS